MLKGLRGLDLAETIAHECYHVRARQRDPAFAGIMPHDEAYAFGAAYRADLEDPEP